MYVFIQRQYLYNLIYVNVYSTSDIKHVDPNIKVA